MVAIDSINDVVVSFILNDVQWRETTSATVVKIYSLTKTLKVSPSSVGRSTVVRVDSRYLHSRTIRPAYSLGLWEPVVVLELDKSVGGIVDTEPDGTSWRQICVRLINADRTPAAMAVKSKTKACLDPR